MATQTLRPNGTVTSASWARTGGTTAHGVLSDDDDATYLIGGSISDWATFDLDSYTLAAGERAKRARVRLRMASEQDDRDTAVAAYYGHPNHQETGGSTTVNEDDATPTDKAGGWDTALLDAADQQAVIDGLRLAMSKSFTFGGYDPHVYEAYLDLEVWERTAAPTVSIAEASAGTVSDTDVPTVQSYTTATNDGTPSLWTREVRVFRDAVYTAGGFDPATETDVEWEQTDTSLGSVSTTSGTPDELQVGEPLANSDTYRAYVRYGKNDVAGETLWSTWSYVEFTLSLTLPTAPTVTVSVDEPNGRQTLTVTTAALTHDTVEQLEVERSDDGGEWATIRGGVLTDVAASTVCTFYDYDAPRGTSLQYRARVTEGLTSSGTTLTSDWTTTGTVAHPNDGRTWLYDVDRWEHVGTQWTLRGTSRQPSEQQGVFHPLGRTTAVVVTAGRTADTVQFGLVGLDDVGNVDDVEALATYTGPLLVKWADGTQEYLRVTSRPCEVRDIGADRRRYWQLQAVQVASGIA